MTFAAQVCLLLSEWITFLLEAVPARSRCTFIELLCGCLMSQDGWVTRVISIIDRKCHWTTYFKMLERGSLKTQALAHQLLRLVLRFCPDRIATLALDDTLVMRWSASAPGAAIRHEHSRKPNRPRYVNAQCWVTLGIVMSRGVLPIRSRLVPLSGNTNKLSIAGALVRAVSSIVPGARVLVDSWYMRRRFVLPLVSRGMRIIGQVRRDTALFLPPEPVDPAAAKRRGRPRQYGQRLTPDQIDALAVERHCLKLYGKSLEVRLRSTLVVVRFLKATVARAVWYEIFDPKKQRWSQRRLLLATETQLVPTQVLQFYASRWGIESLFQNLKRWWGANNHWQQSRRVLELWMQIRSTGYALMHLLALQLPEAFPLADIAPWREHKPVITAGLFAAWMRQHFFALPFRQAYDRKSAKFTFPTPRIDSSVQPAPA
jgi:hypothetical protein